MFVLAHRPPHAKRYLEVTEPHWVRRRLVRASGFAWGIHRIRNEVIDYREALSHTYLKTDIISLFTAPVAQLDRVLGYEPRGRGFESCRAHQKLRGLQIFL